MGGEACTALNGWVGGADHEVMATAVGTGPASVLRQVLRGIGFTLLGLVAVVLAGDAGDWLRGQSGWGDLSATERSAVAGSWLVLVAALVLTWRRLRRWQERPRWLMRCAAVVAFVGLLPMVAVPAPAQARDISHCVPLADAWRPSVSAPAAADIAFARSVDAVEHRRVAQRPYRPSHGAADAYLAQIESPAYSSVALFQLWQRSPGSCASRSRVARGSSAAGLGVGAAAIGLAVRRRRRA